jgi:hypothetical protein
MSSTSDEIRVWLVDRGYNNRDLIILQYATLEGDKIYRREVASQALGPVTAAKDVSPDNFGAIDEPDLRERYAAEAMRMAKQHSPDDSV